MTQINAITDKKNNPYNVLPVNTVNSQRATANLKKKLLIKNKFDLISHIFNDQMKTAGYYHIAKYWNYESDTMSKHPSRPLAIFYVFNKICTALHYLLFAWLIKIGDHFL